jgi:hypothetical protein
MLGIGTMAMHLRKLWPMMCQPRYGMMTMVVEKRNDSWLVVASQNDNADPWTPAEGQMPNLAMPIPGPSQEAH